jgi:hypothetical protein
MLLASRLIITAVFVISGMVWFMELDGVWNPSGAGIHGDAIVIGAIFWIAALILALSISAVCANNIYLKLIGGLILIPASLIWVWFILLSAGLVNIHM